MNKPHSLRKLFPSPTQEICKDSWMKMRINGDEEK